MAYQQPPQYPPPYQPYGQPPPQRPPKRRHTGLIVTMSIVGAVVVLFIIGGIAAALGGKKTPSASGTPAGPSVSASASAHARTASKPRAKAPRQTVTYEVTGSPASITYGPAGSSLNGSVPMRITRTLHNPQFYSISAQLQGGGTVACKLMVNGKAISRATASGGYNIASCEISQDPISGKWSDTNGG